MCFSSSTMRIFGIRSASIRHTSSFITDKKNRIAACSHAIRFLLAFSATRLSSENLVFRSHDYSWFGFVGTELSLFLPKQLSCQIASLTK